MTIEADPFPETALLRLRELLDRHDYSAAAALPAYPTRRVYPFHELEIGWRWLWGRCQNLSTAAFPLLYHRRLERRSPFTYHLYRLFFRHQEIVPEAEVFPADLVECLARARILEVREGRLRALVQVTPLWDRYFLSSIPGRSEGEYVYLGDDSALLGDLVRAEPGSYRRALDLCTGCGVVALAAPSRFTEVLGVDINPTAVALARANAVLNGAGNVRFVQGDLWQAAQGRWDLITANPPYLPLPGEMAHLRHAYGGRRGIETTLAILGGLQEHLEEGGLCLLLSFSPVSRGRDLLLEEALSALGPEFSLDYRVLEKVVVENLASYYTEKGITHFHAVRLKVRRDRQGVRLVRRPGLWARLRRLPLPAVNPGSPPQPRPVFSRLAASKGTWRGP